IDRWHAAYGPAVAEWLRAVGELEALAALATFAYERPGDPFPEFAEDGAVFEADALGHPLIAPPSAVRNDVRFGGDGPHVDIASGSNMAGKSTLRRTGGVTVLRALPGAPLTAGRRPLSALLLAATL